MIAAVNTGIWRYLPLAILMAAWEIGTRTGVISQWALPTLSSVIAAWLGLLRDGDLYVHAMASITRGTAGLFLAVGFGSVLGILMARSNAARIIFNPIVQMFYPMPKSALIPVTILWLGLGSASKIVLIFLGCMLPVTLSAFNGARGVDRTLIWSAQSFGASRTALLWQVIAPGAMPELLTGIRTAIALSFALTVSSEFIAARDGLGYLIASLGDGGAYPAMFAVVLTVAGLGFAADRAFLALMRRMLAWRG